MKLTKEIHAGDLTIRISVEDPSCTVESDQGVQAMQRILTAMERVEPLASFNNGSLHRSGAIET